MPDIENSSLRRGESHFHTNGGVPKQDVFGHGKDTSRGLGNFNLDHRNLHFLGTNFHNQNPQYQPWIQGPTSDPNHLDYDDFYHPPPYEYTAASSSSGRTPVESLPQFFLIEPSPATMSLAYENRGFAEYPQSTIMDDPTPHDHDHMHHQQSYPSPQVDMSNVDYTQLDSALELQMSEVPQQKDDEEDAGSPRAAALTKPVRDIVKNEDGRFVCTWTGCTEEFRTFLRKCEWNKHMDKHDRPYKCTMSGCEKIPGFTYSGGLLRHQREVHNLHGGPRRQLNCPHPNCKRHSGKGFSRQENLNEHLRRVHTTTLTIDGEIPQISEETEQESQASRPKKRKYSEDEFQLHPQPQQQQQQQSSDIQQDNMTRILDENEALRNEVALQRSQITELMRQLTAVQQAIQMQAPQAMM